MEVLEKVRNIIKKKFNRELIYSKKYLKSEKISTKWGFQYLYTPLVLIDLVYRKDEKYYFRVFLEKYYFIEGR